jgi:hypothetical protein
MHMVGDHAAEIMQVCVSDSEGSLGKPWPLRIPHPPSLHPPTLLSLLLTISRSSCFDLAPHPTNAGLLVPCNFSQGCSQMLSAGLRTSPKDGRQACSAEEAHKRSRSLWLHKSFPDARARAHRVHRASPWRSSWASPSSSWTALWASTPPQQRSSSPCERGCFACTPTGCPSRIYTRTH